MTELAIRTGYIQTSLHGAIDLSGSPCYTISIMLISLQGAIDLSGSLSYKISIKLDRTKL